LVRTVERLAGAAIDFYRRSLTRSLAYRPIMLLLTLSALGLTVWLFMVVPKGFLSEPNFGIERGSVIRNRRGVPCKPTRVFPEVSNRIRLIKSSHQFESFLRHDGTVWTTDKDGPIMDLLAAEITARTGKDPGEHYRELTTEFGTPYYTRIDAPATPEEKASLQKLSPEAVKESSLAGEPITAKLTRAPGNNASIGGLKVVAGNGWFAARPSGTENIYKIYAESFKDEAHLNAIVSEAQAIVSNALQQAKGRA
jgi:hypothetical protein